MRVIINGAGIAGPTLAYWLLRHGHEPTLVERAPKLRTGGYVIDFWGTGYDVAERMRLIPELDRTGYHVKELRLVDCDGRRAGGMSVEVFRQITEGRYLSLPRGDLAAAIHRHLDGRVETIFGDSIEAIEETAGGVDVRLESGAERSFDLAVGADGLHSRVRGIAFGPQETFEHRLGYTVAAFRALRYRPRDELVYVSYTTPGRQVARFALHDDHTLFLFVYADGGADAPDPHDVAAHKARLHEKFDAAGWECPEILGAMDTAEDFYADRVSQIRMPHWSKGRVVLTGDAAFCPSLLAGQGSALAMTAAYVLAGEIDRAGGDHAAALNSYEAMLRPFLSAKQAAAEKFAGAFAPRTAFGVLLRNKVTSLMGLPFVARLVMGGTLVDQFALPDYADVSNDYADA